MRKRIRGSMTEPWFLLIDITLVTIALGCLAFALIVGELND